MKAIFRWETGSYPNKSCLAEYVRLPKGSINYVIPRDLPLEKAKEFGADIVINPGKEDALVKGGTFVEFSVMSGVSTNAWSIIGDAKEITINGSQLSLYCYETTIANIVSGITPTNGVVSHVFPLEKWEEAFRVAESREALKVILVP